MAQRSSQVQESKEAFLRMAFFKIDHLCLFSELQARIIFQFLTPTPFQVLFHLNEKQFLAAQVEKKKIQRGRKVLALRNFAKVFLKFHDFDFSSQSSSHRLLRTEAEVYTLLISFYNRWV